MCIDQQAIPRETTRHVFLVLILRLMYLVQVFSGVPFAVVEFNSVDTASHPFAKGHAPAYRDMTFAHWADKACQPSCAPSLTIIQGILQSPLSRSKTCRRVPRSVPSHLQRKSLQICTNPFEKFTSCIYTWTTIAFSAPAPLGTLRYHSWRVGTEIL